MMYADGLALSGRQTLSLNLMALDMYGIGCMLGLSILACIQHLQWLRVHGRRYWAQVLWALLSLTVSSVAQWIYYSDVGTFANASRTVTVATLYIGLTFFVD